MPTASANSSINRNLEHMILLSSIGCCRMILKHSESIGNKGFFADSSPFTFIQFRIVLSLFLQRIRANVGEAKTDNRTGDGSWF